MKAWELGEREWGIGITLEGGRNKVMLSHLIHERHRLWVGRAIGHFEIPFLLQTTTPNYITIVCVPACLLLVVRTLVLSVILSDCIGNCTVCERQCRYSTSTWRSTVRIASGQSAKASRPTERV